MIEDIKVIEVPKENFKGRYEAHVANNGNLTGVLSGSELKGKAREYGGWYFRKRQEVIEKVAALGVEPRAFKARRGAILWADAQTGEPVQLILV